MEGRKVWARAAAATAVFFVSMFIFSVVEGNTGQVVHTETVLYPMTEFGSGDVTNTWQLMDWPAGHIAVRSFEIDVLDEHGISVPLYDVYLHHWSVQKVHVKKGYKELVSSIPKVLPDDGKFRRHLHRSERIAFQQEADAQQVKKYGTCHDNDEMEYAGGGSETRKTESALSAPYGHVSGDVETIPEGYEEAFYLNIHAINTEGIVDTISCDECRCKTYNMTKDETGRPLTEGYEGGLFCCFDKTHCNAETSAAAAKRKFFFKTTIKYVVWDTSVIPVRTYLLDVTDARTSLTEKPNCQEEYAIEQCNKDSNEECIDRRYTVAGLLKGGYVIHASLHQHIGGLGAVLHNKDGSVICQSDALYGTGNEAGNEAGFLVGTTSCNPEPGTIYVETMEELHFEAYYSRAVAHTGVMSVFYLYVADSVSYVGGMIE